ncbi:hypothetical protein [Nocardia wallacei]|uniref:hypothetical protein n=1 Tax=Nocardia wallacei TaxID=480035 RepID=UPI0024555878|nr:hypothetical protein [Nocardia wallacei]
MPKPVRIIRRPKNPDLPPAVPVPLGAGCALCGAHVVDRQAHDRYHAKQDGWARDVNDALGVVLRVLQQRGDIPTGGDTFASGGESPATDGTTCDHQPTSTTSTTEENRAHA